MGLSVRQINGSAGTDVKRRRAEEEDGVDAKTVIAEQAEDDGLWFHAETAAEAYLQQERRLMEETG